MCSRNSSPFRPKKWVLWKINSSKNATFQWSTPVEGPELSWPKARKGGFAPSFDPTGLLSQREIVQKTAQKHRFGGRTPSDQSGSTAQMQKIAKNTGPGGRTPFDQSGSTVRNAKHLQKQIKDPGWEIYQGC